MIDSEILLDFIDGGLRVWKGCIEVVPPSRDSRLVLSVRASPVFTWTREDEVCDDLCVCIGSRTRDGSGDELQRVYEQFNERVVRSQGAK